MSKLERMQDWMCANLAEDAGHMGWTRDDYPGCPARRKAAAERQLQLDRQLEDAFDEASSYGILEQYDE